MIQVASVTAAVHTILSSSSILVNSGFNIELNTELNTDTNKVPWVGVYFGRMAVEPYRANIDTPYMALYEVDIYIQQGNAGSLANLETAMALANEAVWTSINSDRTLLGAAQMVMGYELAPFQRDVSAMSWMGTDILTVRAQAYA